jgi:hypothetical protein
VVSGWNIWLQSSNGIRGRFHEAWTVLSGPGPIVPGIDAEGGAMPGQLEAQELLLIEEADAWFEYLEAIREQTELRYKEIEPWAWARLTQRLRAIRTRKEKLRPAAAA